VSARFTIADLAASGVLDVGRNRQRLAEAAGLPGLMVARTGTAREAPAEHREAVDRPASSAVSPDFWPLLLAVLGEPRRIPRLDGEDAVQAETVFRLDIGVRTRTLPIVAVMVRNDIVQRRAPKHLLERDPGLIRWDERERKAAGREAARATAMGMRKGFPDLFLLNADPACPTERFGLLEGKTQGGSLEPEQRRWRDLCKAAGWHWGLFREPDDALRAVRAWGWA
jgi:hypothetical protein